MDKFDNAFENIGLTNEGIKDTQDKIVEEQKQLGMTSYEEKTEKNPKKIFYGLTEEDRQIAVEATIVPKAYKYSSFDESKVKRNIAEQYMKSNRMYITKNFKKYMQICTEILSTIRMKKLPPRSYLIGAPNGFGKSSFVNECLITLHKQGYKTVPYISLWELAQIRVENEQRIMKPYSRFKDAVNTETGHYSYMEPNVTKGYMKKPEIVTGRFSYTEYINADCLFVCFTDIISKEIESHTLYQLLTIRGAKGLPTIVMISTSLEPYENDKYLKEYVWDEIKTLKENINTYDRVYHISCYKERQSIIESKNENLESDTGIVIEGT